MKYVDPETIVKWFPRVYTAVAVIAVVALAAWLWRRDDLCAHSRCSARTTPTMLNGSCVCLERATPP